MVRGGDRVFCRGRSGGTDFREDQLSYDRYTYNNLILDLVYNSVCVCVCVCVCVIIKCSLRDTKCSL